jgi:1,4-dihydroxy-2-naphthoate octaprenyltransferase
MTIAVNSLDAWILASRPRTLGAMLCPVLLGNALAFAKGNFSLSIMALTLICSSLLQILANVVNDYGDFRRGGDGANRLGPLRAMQMGWLTKSAIYRGMMLILFAIIFTGLPLVIRGGLPILLLGVAGIFTSIWYTAGPRPLSYLGFAELVVFFFFGPLPLMGTYYVQTLNFCPEVMLLSLAPGFLSMALIMANNLRDIEEDRKNQKQTLAVRFGQPFSRHAIALLLLLTILTPMGLIAFYNYPWWLMATAIAMLPSWKCIPIFLYEPISAQFNRAFVGVAKSLYALGILLSLGLIYGHA